MSNLPKVDWDVDPVFLQVPKDLALAIAGAIAVYSLIQGMRRKGSDHYVTALLFGVLGFVVHKYMGQGLELRYYSLLFVGVFLGGYALLKWQIVRGGGRTEDAADFIVYGVLGVLLGARFGHVLFYDLDKAIADPTWVFKIWTGGLASHGAVLGLIFVMWLYCKRRGVPFLEGADRFAFAADLGATLVRVGNLMNSEIVGRKTDQTWGFRFPRFDHNVAVAPYRYPTQLAEIALGCLVMLGLYVADKKLGEEKRPRGALIATFFALYFTGRFFIEFYKEYEGPIEAGSALTMGQVLSIPGIVIGWGGLYLAMKKKIPAGWPVRDDEDEEEEERPKRKKKAKTKTKAKAKAKPVVEESDEDDTNDKARDDADRDSDAGDDDADRDSEAGDDDDDAPDSETGDDDAPDSEAGDDDEDDDDAASPEKPRDADIDDEFDEKGALKRRRE